MTTQPCVPQDYNLARLRLLYRESSGTTQKNRITALLSACLMAKARKDRSIPLKLTFVKATIAAQTEAKDHEAGIR